jgi:putative methionine-R-sulfoxide reductase with GAF domain
MDLYSILGQPIPIDEIHFPEASPAAKAFPSLPLSLESALALRAQAETKLSTILHSAVERVRYITGASGVALALCENEEDAMVCRASSGPAAPEVGARMYIQSGITAESMRTRQTLRCDKASTDPRVNQESCKALGIESVMVMPLIFGRSVVGMFELFGETAAAFEERDAKTLRATAPQVHTGLREAVDAGMTLGRIPWAEEETPTEAATESYMGEANISSRGETHDPADITLRVPVAFPIDSFKKAEAPAGAAFESLRDEELQNEEHEVPAFLARLADEARPAGGRSWSQWFRPQW